MRAQPEQPSSQNSTPEQPTPEEPTTEPPTQEEPEPTIPNARAKPLHPFLWGIYDLKYLFKNRNLMINN